MEPGGKVVEAGQHLLLGWHSHVACCTQQIHTPTLDMFRWRHGVPASPGATLHRLVRTPLSTKQTRPYSERQGQQGDGRQTKSDLIGGTFRLSSVERIRVTEVQWGQKPGRASEAHCPVCRGVHEGGARHMAGKGTVGGRVLGQLRLAG